MKADKWFRNKRVYPVIVHKILCSLGFHKGRINTHEEKHGNVTTYWCVHCKYMYFENDKGQKTCSDGEVIR